MEIKKDYYYTEDHEWVAVEGNIAMIGISDFAQHALGDIVYVELPETEEVFEAGDEFAVIESVKAASDVFMPIGGKIVAINEELEDDPALLNEDAYANWLAKVEFDDDTELEKLMNAEAYQQFCAEEE